MKRPIAPPTAAPEICPVVMCEFVEAAVAVVATELAVEAEGADVT